MPNVRVFSSTDLMKLIACRMTKKIVIVQYSVMLSIHLLNLFPLILKPSKAEPEQAPPTEPKAEEPPAAVPPAAGLDLGLDTQAEELVEGAEVSATSLPPSPRLPCH